MPGAREFIEEIKSRHVNSDKEYVLDSLTGAIDRLQKAFPRYGSFLMEFVQNADDAKSKSLKIEILANAIRVSNDGIPFSDYDVKSICKVGRSSKTPKDYIGYLGVGFKAVFLISEQPEIHSGEYHFKFDKNSLPDPEHTPWQVIPLWIDNSDVQFLDEYKTVFCLPLKDPKLVDRLRQEVKPEYLSNRIILFLRNVRNIEILDHTQNSKKQIVKSEHSKTPDYEIYNIQEYENGTLKTQDYWLMFRSICDVPEKVKEDYITKEWERGSVQKREVIVAFRLTGGNTLVKEEKGTAHIGVFSFLPLKEIPSGLNFLIQADFLTTPGRGEFARECLWNNWLANEIYNLIINKSISAFLEHDKWRMNFTDVLYSMEGGHELFEFFIKEPIRRYLEKNAVLIADDESLARFEESISIDIEVKNLLTKEDVQILYPGKKVIHDNCKPSPNLKIEKAPYDIYQFISSSKGEELIRRKAELKDIEWFKKLYSLFVDKYDWNYFYKHYYQHNVEHDNFWNRMHNFDKPIILIENYGLAKINECFTNPKKLKIPKHIKEKFKIVHPQLIKEERFNKLIHRLNEERYYHNPPDTKVIRELTEEDIKNTLKKQETLELDSKTWAKLSEKERIEKIRYLRDLWAAGYLSLGDYDFLSLKSKNGKWVRPENLVFSKEYKPEHNVEILTEKGLLDFPLKFVSPEFIDSSNDDEIRKWRKFFEEMGVDNIVESGRKEGGKKGGIVHRISILTALRFEAKNKRSSRELGESEKLGYDIESKSESEEKYIEVKGTSDSSYDIFLTVNEFRTLKDKQDKYFIYVVIDALRNPVLYVTRGDKLLDITDTKIIIPFSEWRDHAKDEEYQP